MSECEGHESLNGADMGVTVECDGTCISPPHGEEQGIIDRAEQDPYDEPPEFDPEDFDSDREE